MMQRSILGIVVLLCFVRGFSQRLVKGQALPPMTFTGTLNTGTDTFSLSRFIGTPLLIEFWSFNCTVCFQSFPKMEAWQEKYRGKVNLLLVNLNSKEETMAFFKKFENSKAKIKMPKLPMVTGDKTLSSYFALRGGYPHTIWIDGNGIFRYQTHSVKEKQLVDFIEGREPEIVEVEPKEDFVHRTSLIEQPNKDYLKQIRYYSYVASYLPSTDIGNAYGETGEGNTVRIKCNSGTIVNLLSEAFAERPRKYQFKWGINMELMVKDTSRFIYPDRKLISDKAYEVWQSKNLWRYECAVPKEKKADLFRYMQEDLCRIFDLEVKIEKRKTRCWALVVTDSSKLQAAYTQVESAYQRQQESGRQDTTFLRNLSMERFFDYLQGSLYFKPGVAMPIVDHTAYRGEVSMAFPVSGQKDDLEWWQNVLKEYGLRLIEVEDTTDILSIREK